MLYNIFGARISISLPHLNKDYTITTWLKVDKAPLQNNTASTWEETPKRHKPLNLWEYDIFRCNQWQGESKNQTYGISPRIYKKYGKKERHKIYINLQLTKTNPCAITCWLCMIKMRWRLGQVCLQARKICSPRWFHKSCQADCWP